MRILWLAINLRWYSIRSSNVRKMGGRANATGGWQRVIYLLRSWGGSWVKSPRIAEGCLGTMHNCGKWVRLAKKGGRSTHCGLRKARKAGAVTMSLRAGGLDKVLQGIVGGSIAQMFCFVKWPHLVTTAAAKSVWLCSVPPQCLWLLHQRRKQQLPLNMTGSTGLCSSPVTRQGCLRV
jgi:hypothetical protein